MSKSMIQRRDSVADSKSARTRANLDVQDKATCTKRPPGQRLTILDLPVEIIFNIVDGIFNTYPEDLWCGYGRPFEYWVAELDYLGVRSWPHFDVWRDVVRLMYTCKTLYNAVWPILYQKDATYNESSALILSAMKGNSAGVAKSLAKGGDAFAAYREFSDWEHFSPDDLWMCSGTTERTTVWTHEVCAIHWAAFNRDCQSLRHIEEFAFIYDRQSSVDFFTPDNRFICKSLHAVLHQFEPIINQLQVPSSQPLDRRHMIEYLKSILRKGPKVPYFALINVSTKKFRENWVSTSSKDTVEMLIEAKRDMESWFPASSGENVEMPEGSDVFLITHLGTKLHALHQACGGRDVDTARFILQETTTSVDIRDAFENTPLHHVALCKRSEEDTDDPPTTDPRSIVQLLLVHGADINARNLAGHTPLQECFTTPGYPNVDVAVALLQEGARKPESLNDLIEGVDIQSGDEPKLVTAWATSIGPQSSSTSLETLDVDRHKKSTNWLYKLTCCINRDEVDYSKCEATEPKSWSQWYAWLADSPSRYGDPFIPK